MDFPKTKFRVIDLSIAVQLQKFRKVNFNKELEDLKNEVSKLPDSNEKCTLMKILEDISKKVTFLYLNQ